MLNSINLVGELGPIVEGLERTVIVRRPYHENCAEPVTDTFAVIYWSRNKSNPFYRVEAHHLVGIKGRVEMCDNRMVIIAEQVNYL